MNSARIGQRLQDCVRRRRMARSRRPGQHALEPFLQRVRHRSLLRHLRAPGGLQMAPPGSIDKLEGHQETLVPNRLRKESADKRRRRQAGDREARREDHGGQLLHAFFLSCARVCPHQSSSHTLASGQRHCTSSNPCSSRVRSLSGSSWALDGASARF